MCPAPVWSNPSSEAALRRVDWRRWFTRAELSTCGRAKANPYLASARFWWDNLLMTVIADAKRRVVLPPVKPGDRFDVELSANGKLVLTPLIPDERPSQVKLVRRHGYLVAVSSRPITQAQTRAYLDEFP